MIQDLIETNAIVTTAKIIKAYPTTCPRFNLDTTRSLFCNSEANIWVTLEKY